MSNTIYITGAIYYPEDVQTDSGNYNIVTPEDVRQQIANITSQDVLLQVGSDGGNILAALEMYADLQSSGLNIQTLGINRIGSAGTVLFLLPDDINNRKLVKGTKSYIHAPISSTYNGNVIKHIERAEVLSQFTNLMAFFYSEKLGIDENEALQLMFNDTVWTDEEAVSNKMASEIVEVENKVLEQDRIEMSYTENQLNKGVDILKRLIVK